MKAIYVRQAGDPAVLVLQDIVDPVPAAGEVLVRLCAVGVNPVDTYIRSGTYPGSTFPYIPGSDGSGVVESVGEDVTRVKPGHRVYVYARSTYAELCVAPENRVFPLPDHVSFEQGAAIGVPYATAYRALFQRAHGLPGETVLVHGATGGVGTAAIQFARAAGLQVIGTAGSDEGMNQVLNQGAHHAVNHHDPDAARQILSFTAGHGVNIVLEMLANVNTAQDLNLVATGGRIVIIGSRGPTEIDLRGAMAKEAAILGVMLAGANEPQLSSIHAAIGAGLENKTLCPLVGQNFPLKHAAQAHEAIMQPGSHGKIILYPS